MKFVVGAMLSAFGTFWVGEGLGVGWPGEDQAVFPLVGLYLILSLLAVWSMQSRHDPYGELNLPQEVTVPS